MVEGLQNVLKYLKLFTCLLITNQRAMGRITQGKAGCSAQVDEISGDCYWDAIRSITHRAYSVL